MRERCPRCDRPECPGWAYVGGIRVCYTPDAVDWRARALAAEAVVRAVLEFEREGIAMGVLSPFGGLIGDALRAWETANRGDGK